MAIYTTSSSAAGIRITASGSNSGHTILDGVALESTSSHVIEFSGTDGSLTVGGYAIGFGGQYAVNIVDGAQDIVINILESGHLFGGGLLTVPSSELIRVNFINAGNAYGNDTGYFGSDGVDKIINSGFLGASAGIAIHSTNGNDEVYNSGTIQGNVILGDDNDLYDGRGGTVIGEVHGGFGDDTYIIDDATTALIEVASQGTDTVQSTVNFTLGDNFENLTLIGSGNLDGYGNGESNVLTGNSGNNVMNGLGSADTLFGGAGDDRVNGGNGIDNLFGGEGDDKLRGQKGFDVLKAEAGNDSISGGQGDDNLFGGDDNDILKGGMGKDKLYGGDDADVFLYTKAAHSKNDSTADTIKDFELGLDTIDLVGVAAGTLTFIGSGAFSGTQGEVQVTGATNSTVLVDVDGDGTADMKISVIGVTGLGDADFVL